MRTPSVVIAVLCAAAGQASAVDTPLLHALFGDHAVLQRDRPVVVWGRSAPGDDVEVTLASAAAKGRADASGRWSATLPALPAGGPYELVARARSGASQTVSDVVLGDVWLCSGQSNMALSVARSLNSAGEIASSANERIRTLTVPQAANPAPQDAFAAAPEWKPAGPSTTGTFSAACYYFARELQKTVDVPMGLVVSAWGGSKIQPWIGAEATRALGGENELLLDILEEYARDPARAAARFGALWQEWWKRRVTNATQAEPWNVASPDGAWRAAPSGLGYWEGWGVPELAAYNGIVLYRTRLVLTEEQAARPAVLSIGAVDEIDVTWVNGAVVGSSSGGERRYRLSAGVLHAGENLIVVSDLDTYANGGIYGPAEKRALVFDDGSTLPLGPWQYLVAPADVGQSPRAPWESTAGVTTIANGMIAPLGSFGFRGALWYQGESNSYLVEGEAYERQLAALMADWRRRFGAPLPFLVVQLPGYGNVPTAPVESGWALVREGQRRAVLHDAHAGLAVAIDVGEPYELHPANKQEVGRRLARAARRVVYGEAVTNGPFPDAAHRRGAQVVVDFRDVTGRLLAKSGQRPTAFELCPPAPRACRYVDAALEGDRVVLDAAGLPGALRVRHGWGDAPVCTLTDESGLPAPPFELEIR